MLGYGLVEAIPDADITALEAVMGGEAHDVVTLERESLASTQQGALKAGVQVSNTRFPPLLGAWHCERWHFRNAGTPVIAAYIAFAVG